MKSDFLLLLIIVLGIAYAVIGMMAYSQRDESKLLTEADKLLAKSVWWPFYDYYMPAVKNLCFAGKILCVVEIILWSFWYFMK